MTTNITSQKYTQPAEFQNSRYFLSTSRISNMEKRYTDFGQNEGEILEIVEIGIEIGIYIYS